MIIQHSRRKYFGLFLGGTKFLNIVSVVLLVINVLTIVWLDSVSVKAANHIINWDDTHSLCPDNSMFFTVYLLNIFAFWGIINLTYGIYHLIVRRKEKGEERT
jgi:hypothetical protein